jgi:hypothetical protein
MKRQGELDADRIARRETPGRHDRRGHHGGKDRDRRDHGKTSAKIRKSSQRKGGRKSAFPKIDETRAFRDRKKGRRWSMGQTVMTDQTTPKTAPSAEQQQLMALMRAPVPRLYANGYAIISSASDISVGLLFNGTPVGVTSMSYITAKSLIIDLQKALGEFEKAIDQKVKTIDEITMGMSKIKGPGHDL